MTPYSESNISPRLRRSQPTSTQADQMIGGDWEVERQTPDSSNMEVGNGMRKTDQWEVMENWAKMIKANRINII